MSADPSVLTVQMVLREVTLFREICNVQLDAIDKATRLHTAEVKEQFAAVDLRYQQRFDASERALIAALGAAEKAVSSALQAAEKAVQKAEMAAEKRFEAVNEFRAALTDQTNALMPRVEATARIDSLGEKIADVSQRLAANKGAHDTGQSNQASLIAAAAVLIALVGLGLSAYRGSPSQGAPQIVVAPPATITH